jgi:hypothetical protein
MADIHIHQIFYDKQTRALLDPGYIPLDNQANERPDWTEYWPIRKFLLGRTLTEGDYYAFLSPRFALKTGLSSTQVREFISRQGIGADVVIFCPYFDHSALFRNVFEQGENFHRGLMGITHECLERIGWTVDIKNLITDSSNTIFCNYFAAKPPFWRKWLALNEKLFQIAERPPGGDDLVQRLNAQPPGKYVAQMKVFVLERMATLILATSAELTAKAYSPFLLGASRSRLAAFVEESVLSDALKIAWARSRDPAYGKAYYRVRKRIDGKLKAGEGK